MFKIITCRNYKKPPGIPSASKTLNFKYVCRYKVKGVVTQHHLYLKYLSCETMSDIRRQFLWSTIPCFTQSNVSTGVLILDFLIKGNLFVTKTGHVLCCFHVSSSLVRLRKMVNVEITMVME